MFGIIFDYYSPTHGYHKWVVIKDMPHSRYCLCAIISSSKNKHSVELSNSVCDSLKKTSYIQLDNLLSVPKDIIYKNQKELLCSHLVNILKKKFKNVLQ